MAIKRKAIVKKEDNQVMSELMGMETNGFENVTNGSLQMPFLKIAQRDSPQAIKEGDAYVEGLEPGLFFNNVTETIYGKEIKIVFLYYYEVYTEWGKKQGEYYGVHNKKDIENNELYSKEGMIYIDKEEHRYVDTRNFFVYLPDFPNEGILLFSLSSSGITPAKKILKEAMHVKYNNMQAPLFSIVWKLGTLVRKKDNHTWYQIGDSARLAMEKISFIDKNEISTIKDLLLDAKEYSKQILNIDYKNNENTADKNHDF